MKRFHLALATQDVDKTVDDYQVRLGCGPTVHIGGEYALFRTPCLNLSVRHAPDVAPGTLRHLGFEDPEASGFASDVDVNGITWERFDAQSQSAEIRELWPDADTDQLD